MFSRRIPFYLLTLFQILLYKDLNIIIKNKNTHRWGPSPIPSVIWEGLLLGNQEA